MARKSEKTRSSRLRAVPWAALLQGGLLVSRRLGALSQKDRARLARLVRESGGRPRRLSERDREELRRLIRKLDLAGMGRELLPLARSGRRRGR